MSERGHLQVDVSGNASGFRQVLNSCKTHAQQFSKEVDAGINKGWSGLGKSMVGGIIGGLSFSAISGAFSSFLQRASGIRELSEQLEMGTDETQKWEKAVDRLGLSFTGLQGVINSIRDKRIEALTDPKAASLFERLGIARADVVDQNRVGASDFAAMVLRAGRGSEENRSALSDIVGRRGVRYAGAADIYQGMTPDVSESAIGTAHEAELAERKAKGFIGRLMSGIVTGIVQYVEDANADYKVGMFDKSIQENTSDAALPLTRGKRKKGTPAPGTVDPLESVLAEAESKRAERYASANERIAEAQRRNMNYSEKRASLEQELTDNRRRQSDLDARLNKGAPANLKSPEEKAEWEMKTYEDWANLKAKEQGIMGELHEKPMQLGADGLAKSGLFSGSALNFGMGDGTQRAQLDCLRTLVRQGANHRDPHSL